MTAKHLAAPLSNGPCLLFKARNQLQTGIFKPVQPLIGCDVSVLIAYQHIINHPDFAANRLEMVNQRIIADIGNTIVKGCPDIIVHITIQAQNRIILQLVISILLPKQVSLFAESIQPVGDSAYHVTRVFCHYRAINSMALQFFITIRVPGADAGRSMDISSAIAGQQQHSAGIRQPCQNIAITQILTRNQGNKLITCKSTDASIDQLGIQRVPDPEKVQGKFRATDSLRPLTVVYKIGSE